MKLMYEDNYPDNVSSMDPHFNYPDPVFDANEVRYAKVNYTAIDSEQDYEEFDETLYVDKFDPDAYNTSFAEYVQENAFDIVADYLLKEGGTCDLISVNDIVFVDDVGNEFYSDDIQF